MKDGVSDAFAATQIAAIGDALTTGALPGEAEDLDGSELDAAARFVAAALEKRQTGEANVRLESVTQDNGRRFLRLAVINDDMPFLVDSVAAAVHAHNLSVIRLLHPIIAVARDGNGVLENFGGECDGPKESVVYLEADRADARTRRALLSDIHRVLADVHAAVKDWPEL